MVLILAVIAIALFGTTQCGCPIRCNCTENAVDCVSKNFEYVPYFERLTNNPVIIDLSGNSISIIDEDGFSFDKSDQVKEIYLNHSELITIEELAFVELINLQELYLADNYLSTLPVDFITKNENIILLDLSSNYFAAMPKIRSESLEVLAIANSAMSEIPKDSLEHLPNLRTLLIQQNNLKHIDSVIFETMPKFFFVKMAYNPWKCSCKTVKLFNYLTERNLVDISEPVQCLTDDKTFVKIYDQHGITETFKNNCDNADLIPQIKGENLLKQSKVNAHKEQIEDERHSREEQDVFSSDMFYSSVLVVSIFLSFLLGATFGSYYTRKFMLLKMRPSSSAKELLKYPA